MLSTPKENRQRSRSFKIEVRPVIVETTPIEPFKEKNIVFTDEGVEIEDKIYKLHKGDYDEISELGRGHYGVVKKVFHREWKMSLAVKEMQLTEDENSFKQIAMELKVLSRSTSPFIVGFYGSFFSENKVYYGMEYMDGGSLDQLYTGGTPEPIIARIAFAMVSGLKYMKDQLQMMHRDIKPTNVVVNLQGDIKLCDFGVSGQLEKSLARTFVGCQYYMAPERINSSCPEYGVYSDVWSLGLSLVEVAIGAFPYEKFDSIFSQITELVNGKTPTLPEGVFSPEAIDFCSACMLKDYTKRPSYAQLLEHKFIKKYAQVKVDVVSWVHDGTTRRQAKKEGKPVPNAKLTAAAATDYII